MVLQALLSRGAKLATPKTSLRHVDYFQPDTIKAPKTQDNTLTFPLTAQRIRQRTCSVRELSLQVTHYHGNEVCEREETHKACLLKFLCGSHSLCLALQTLVWYMFAFHLRINCLLPLWCPLLLPPTSSLALAEDGIIPGECFGHFGELLSFLGSLPCIHAINLLLDFHVNSFWDQPKGPSSEEKNFFFLHALLGVCFYLDIWVLWLEYTDLFQCTVMAGIEISWLKSFLGGSDGKECACQCRRHKRLGLIPESVRSPWRREW